MSSTISPESFAEFYSQLQGSALNATKQSASLPSDLTFYRSMGKEVSKEIDTCSTRVLALTNRLLGLMSSDTTGQTKGKKRARLEDEEDVTDSFRSLVIDAMDQMLEQTDMRLDEILGLTKAPAIAINPEKTPVPRTHRTKTPAGGLDPGIQHAANLPKPQLKFKRKADNFDSSTWQSTLRHKYNAQVPLGYNLRSEGDEEDALSSLHPYHYEIKNTRYPETMFTSTEPIEPKSFEETPFVWVDTAKKLAAMLDELRSAREIAIDLEHHSYRTFSGFVCLMQISSRSTDWVVDTLALREELEDLNEVFTDPNIVKVLHGADSDIVWLQQDFNLYIVNLFDTYHASKVLDFPRHNLATLLEMYCDFTADKKYQLADWRIRPLPQEMLHYARSDTHFLLFIYDNLKNALLDKSRSRSHSPAEGGSSAGASPNLLMHEVLSRSGDTALRVYEREIYDAHSGFGPGGWESLAKKWNKIYLTGEGSKPEVYKSIHAWRDKVAREEDESTRYVLPNHQLFKLAEQPPEDMATFMGMLRPMPAVVKRRARELLDCIREALKRSSGATTEPVAEIVPEVVMKVVDTPATMQQEAKTHHLFPSIPGSSTSAKASSSLFGESLKSAPTKTSPPASNSIFSTGRSSLFKELNNSQIVAASGSRANRLSMTISRIHNNLVVAPSVPKVQSLQESPASAQASEKMPAVTEDDTIVQAEIPFVPAHSRQQSSIATTDEVITVGVSKKRKRQKKALPITGKGKGAADTPMDEDGGDIQPVEAFDFSSASNLLDEGSDHEAPGIARRKKPKGEGNFYGDFRAPPKAHSQLKAGNVSRTFK